MTTGLGVGRAFGLLALFLGVGLAAVGPGPRHARAQEPAGDDMKIMYIVGLKKGAAPLRTDYMLSSMYVIGNGGGRNTLELELDDGVLLVDTKLPAYGERLADKIRLATDRPITMIINSNPGGAHTNSVFTEVVDIYAHENTKARLAKTAAFTGASARFLPNKTFTDTLSVTLKTVGEHEGTNRVDLFHFGRAHSDGDIVAVFPSFAVAYFGELFPERRPPTIDVANGGSALAFPDTLERFATALKDAGVASIVPAHAPLPFKVVGNWFTMDDLQQYIAFNRDLIAATRAAKTAGANIDDAVKRLDALLGSYEGYSMDNAPAYVAALYGELAR